WPNQRVTRDAREAVVGIVAVLIRISGDGCAHGPSAADGDYARYFPVVEQPSHPLVIAMKRLGRDHSGEYEAMALIRDAGTFFRVRRVRVLHRGRTSCDQRVLSIVDRVS